MDPPNLALHFLLPSPGRISWFVGWFIPFLFRSWAMSAWLANDGNGLTKSGSAVLGGDGNRVSVVVHRCLLRASMSGKEETRVTTRSFSRSPLQGAGSLSPPHRRIGNRPLIAFEHGKEIEGGSHTDGLFRLPRFSFFRVFE